MPTTLNKNHLTINRVLASGRYLLIGVEEDEARNLKADMIPVGVTKEQIERSILAQADNIMKELEAAGQEATE